MKRIIAMLTMAIMLMAWPSAYAEEFSFRGDITFRHMLVTIALKECDNLKCKSYTKHDESLDDIPPTFHNCPYEYVTRTGDIAGMPDSSIVYRFNAQQRLREADYFFRDAV